MSLLLSYLSMPFIIFALRWNQTERVPNTATSRPNRSSALESANAVLVYSSWIRGRVRDPTSRNAIVIDLANSRPGPVNGGCYRFRAKAVFQKHQRSPE